MRTAKIAIKYRRSVVSSRRLYFLYTGARPPVHWFNDYNSSAISATKPGSRPVARCIVRSRLLFFRSTGRWVHELCVVLPRADRVLATSAASTQISVPTISTIPIGLPYVPVRCHCSVFTTASLWTQPLCTLTTVYTIRYDTIRYEMLF